MSCYALRADDRQLILEALDRQHDDLRRKAASRQLAGGVKAEVLWGAALLAGPAWPSVTCGPWDCKQQTSQVFRLSSCGRVVVGPGGGLVVAGAGLQTAVQDADESVGELA